MIHLAFTDTIIIALYFGAVLFVGFRAGRKTQSSAEDFLLAGRSLTLPIFVMTLVSTWYGGILGVGEFSYRYGISNWIVQGVPYYIFAAVFAFLLAKKIRATNLYSIPDKLAQSYDKKTALLGSFLTFILMTPAPYILMLSVFLQMLFGWSLFVSLIVTAIVAVSYLYVGGFRSDVETDVLEFVLMFAGFAVIIPFCFNRFGGSDFLNQHLPPLHLTWHGGNSIQYILVWFFIALWTLVDPAFHQRCYAAKDGRIAQHGILISIFFWFLFDFMTATAGLYARAALPDLQQPIMAYPMLAEAVLPPIAKGLFYVGMLATIMSTLNTLAFVSAQTLGRDIVMRLGVLGSRIGTRFEVRGSGFEWKSSLSNLQPQTPNRLHSSVLLTQVGLIVSFGVSVALALLIPSVIQLWYTIGTIIIPGLLVPLIASYFDGIKIPPRYAFLSMLLGWLTSLAWMVSRYTILHSDSYPLGIEPMYPGLFVSLLFWGIGRSALREGK
ncbi:MAG: sodium:solute symporter family protein [Ignavibacteriae bacterium]|nr:sodium:solute symporter family protein [Ignavibacteria bacterium]MBI3363524.1 sodium:solute symporter family protein [Ignavibacteriota bacterium]